MRDKVLEAEIFVGSDHKVTVELPPEVVNQRVKVTAETEPPVSTSENAPTVPTLEEILKWPVRREHPMVFQGLAKIPPEVFEPMGEEKLGDWENNLI